jgi:hypothetical protein
MARQIETVQVGPRLAVLPAGASSSGGTVFSALTSVTFDLANGECFVVPLSGTATAINNPIYTGGSITLFQQIRVYLLTNGAPGNPSPTWGSAFAPDVQAVTIDSSDITRRRSTLIMTFLNDSKWHLDNFLTSQLT